MRPLIASTVMRPLFSVAVFFLFSSAALRAAEESPGSALGAIKLLPKGESKRIARIEAREGTPIPERWHILVHDPKDENGVHEFVVAGGEVVASRNISQFAESLKETDVFGASGLKIDSDKVAALAQRYAQANDLNIAALNYALKKEGAAATPLWHLSCLDETGREIGRLVVSAGRGNVISHDGFPAEPGAEVQLDTQATSVVAQEDRPRPRRTFSRTRVATPVPEKKDIFSRMGNSINKFFTGKDADRR
jgi:hypothetical protein